MSTEESTTRLRFFLEKEQKVDTVVVDKVLSHGIASISDFAGFYKEDEYEEGVKADMLKDTPFEADRLQISRLRVAWKMATRQTNNASLTEPSSSSHMDMDEPLDPELKKSALQSFKAHYKLTFEGDHSPNDMLFGRLFREFRKRNLSIYPLHKVKSQAQMHPVMDNHTRRIGLSAGVNIMLQDASSKTPDVPITSLLQLLRAMKILCVGWGQAGMQDVNSKVSPGTTTKDGNLSLCLQYYDFVFLNLEGHDPPRPTGT